MPFHYSRNRRGHKKNILGVGGGGVSRCVWVCGVELELVNFFFNMNPNLKYFFLRGGGGGGRQGVWLG